MSHSHRPDVQGFLAFLNALPGPRTHQMSPADARTVYRASRDAADLPTGDLAVIRDLSAPGPAGPIPLRLFDMSAERPAGPVVVFYHGGGFVIGDLDTHGGFCAEMARQLDLPVIAVDYRLAPEHPFPAAPDDCEAATRWIAGSPAELGLSVTGLVPCGDSAGGNLAIVTAMALRDTPAAVPAIAQFAIYPTVDIPHDYLSYELFGEAHLLTRDSITWFDAAYRGDRSSWRSTPLHGSHHDMPPTLVMTAGLDPLRDQGRAYAAALIAAGVATTYREADGNIHGFITLRKAIASGQKDVELAFSVLKTIIGEAA